MYGNIYYKIDWALFFNTEHVKIVEFAKSFGWTRQYVYMLKKQISISESIYRKILEIYPVFSDYVIKE